MTFDASKPHIRKVYDADVPTSLRTCWSSC